MTIRIKILLYVALAIFVLVAARVAGLFLPPVAALWLWRVILVPYVLAGGITALVLLLTIVLCLGRIRYHVDANLADGKTAYIEVSYLMRLVHFVLVYRDGKLDNSMRIAWMRLGEDKPNKKRRKAKNAGTTNDTPGEKNIATNTIASDTGKSDYINKDNDHVYKATKDSEPTQDNNANPELEKEKKDRLKPLKQAKAVLTYPDRKIIMGLCFKCLQKFIRALKPKRLDISGVIGFDDPCTTGWAMGAYEAAAGVMQLRHKVRLVGNYCEKALDLIIQVEGRTRVWGLLWPFIWLYLHKPIRVVLHQYIF